MSIVLAHSNYGKSRVRMVKVARHPDRHELQDIEVKIALEGEFEAVHTKGDNSLVLPTDTMKNTVYALAKQVSGLEEIEEFALRLAHHFLKHNPQVSRVIIEIAENRWARIDVDGKPHHHSFVKASDERRTTKIIATRDQIEIASGVEDLLVLKTTGSAFKGFIKDPFTTLKETDDRIFATSVKAVWRYTHSKLPFAELWNGIHQTILETFAEHDSLSVQQTLYAIGQMILETCGDVVEVSLSLPNKHCLLVDLSPFGMQNNNEIFLPIDEPHGLIEATLTRR